MTAVAGCQWRQSPINAGRKYYLPHLHLAPPLGVTPVEFHRDLRCQNTRVHGLSCGVVLHLAVWVCIEHRLVTDRQTHDYGIYHDSMASRGKKNIRPSFTKFTVHVNYGCAIRYVLPVLRIAGPCRPTCHPSRRRMPSSAAGPVQALRIVRARQTSAFAVARGEGAKSEIRIALFIFRFSSTDIAYPKLHLYPKSTSVQHF